MARSRQGRTSGRFLTGICLLGGCLTALPTAAQTVRALVLGIDAYEHVQQLGGADNDARLLARALAPPVARNVTLMLDQQVHRNAVLKAMDALVDDSAPGDAVIVTYSGHGAREQVPLSEDPQGFRLGHLPRRLGRVLEDPPHPRECFLYACRCSVACL